VRGLEVVVLETPSLGDRSYLVTDGAEALVVDPQRDIERFLAAARGRGVTITAVAETHVHNDYLTGGNELARRTGAAYLAPVGAGLASPCLEMADGCSRAVGSMSVRVLATPGHTPDHVAYLVSGSGAGGSGAGGSSAEGCPPAVFTGGSLLYGTVGRTDLVGDDLTESLAHAQHRSVRRLLADLDPETVVLPTHGFGSHCSATVSGLRSGTVADERGRNPAAGEESTFVADLLAGYSPYPAYYARMAAWNRAGPAPLELPPLPALSPAQLARGAAQGHWVVDLRGRGEFARGHLPGSVNVELRDTLPAHLGWLLPPGTPLALVGERVEEVEEARLMLARIGIEAVCGRADESWPDHASASYPVVDGGELLRVGPEVVVDVRDRREHRAGHLPEALSIPFHEVPDRLCEIPAGQVWVHCASGLRAGLAASLLARSGRDVVLVDGPVDVPAA
jgi:glyoxylase-like metal-dependent hydrolase (beta-lactamase superfamily II)/rhodanese-related sulfurtransferase